MDQLGAFKETAREMFATSVNGIRVGVVQRNEA
jgi:hypothetical protein